MIRSSRSMLGLPLIAAIAFFMQGLDATILNTALPDLAKSLNRSPLSIQSAIISYTLTVAMLIPISGWLADRFGVRHIFILSVSLFSLGSLLCALSYSLPFLVVSRVIQGVGGAMMMPVARLALLRTYPRNELLPILNFVTIPGLLGPIIGPLLGGFLVSYASWHWIFIINIPIGILGILYAQKHMTNSVMPKKSFDMVGFLLFGFSLVMISVSLEFLSESHSVHLLYYGIMAAGFLMLLLYILHAKNHTDPLIELSLFKIRTFSVGIGGNIATRLGTGSVPFLMPLMLQIGFGYSPAVAGCIMAPFAVGGIMGKSFVTRILRRMRYRKALCAVTFMIGIMISLFSLQTANTPFWITVLPLLVLGLLMSIQLTSMNTITLSDLTDNNASSGNSVLAVSQQMAISYGVAFSAIVFQFFNTVGYGNKVDHFHYTFMTMGVFTILSGVLFLLLKPEDGKHLISRSVVKKSP